MRGGQGDVRNRQSSSAASRLPTSRQSSATGESSCPELGAPGISAPEVARRSGFSVEYGPVRALDLPEYLTTHTVTPAMRRVEFPVQDRIVLAPVELVTALPMFLAAIVLWFLAGPIAALAAVSTILVGTVAFPVLLPFIPTRDFSTKGLLLGGLTALPFAVAFGLNPALPPWADALAAATVLLVIPAVVAYLALNFTGSTDIHIQDGREEGDISIRPGHGRHGRGGGARWGSPLP